MSTLTVVANRATQTSVLLGDVLTPAPAVSRLRPGDVALGRLDVLQSLNGVEPGRWALDLLEQRGITALNGSRSLLLAHDKLSTAVALAEAGLPHPATAHIAPWLPLPEVEPPFVLKPRFGSWGHDVFRCNTHAELAAALVVVRHRVWFNSTGGILQRLVPPLGFDLRVVVAGGRVVGSVQRVSRPGEWRTNVALGASRIPVSPSDDVAELAAAAAAATGGDLVGVDLLPTGQRRWTIIEVNGAVDFTSVYSSRDVFAAARAAVLRPRALAAAAPLHGPDRIALPAD